MGATGCGSDGPSPGKEATPLDPEVGEFPPLPITASNPLTVEGVALGRHLFYDPILSSDSTVACASCHVQSGGFGDSRRFSLGVGGAVGTAQAPALINVAWHPELFWDGRAEDLEEQAIVPVEAPSEMNLPWPMALERLRASELYEGLFEAAFPQQNITQDLTTRALAQFQRTFISKDSRFDRSQRGEIELSEQEERGYFKYLSEEVGDCFHCHGVLGLFSPFGSGFPVFENNGLDASPGAGRQRVTLLSEDFGKFKVPSLRNVEVSGPYMHDGRLDTLMGVLDHYSEGVQASATLNTKLNQRLQTNQLSMSLLDKEDIIAFLHTLTDNTFLNREDLSNPFEDN